MASVREILLQSGVDQYTINSLDERVTGALQNVLSEAELQKTNVDQFWANTYAPGIQQWEQEKSDLGRRLAASESQRAAYERERQVLVEQGLVTGDNSGRPKGDGGYMPNSTPGTPTFVDPNEIVSRAGQGLTQLADIEWKHRNVFGKPMGIPPSQLVAEADRQGISLAEAAERKFGFSKREAEQHETQIRADERAKVQRETVGKYGDSTGGVDPMAHNRPGAGLVGHRKAVEAGQLKDPTRMSPQERRTQALNSIHRAVEERQQRDA